MGSEQIEGAIQHYGSGHPEYTEVDFSDGLDVDEYDAIKKLLEGIKEPEYHVLDEVNADFDITELTEAWTFDTLGFALAGIILAILSILACAFKETRLKYWNKCVDKVDDVLSGWISNRAPAKAGRAIAREEAIRETAREEAIRETAREEAMYDARKHLTKEFRWNNREIIARIMGGHRHHFRKRDGSGKKMQG